MPSPVAPTRHGGAITSSHIARLLRGRVFKVAPRSDMRSVGKEITNMITHGKNITHSLSIASRILCKLAAHDLDHTRTVAWVASIIYARLESDHEKLAWDFRLELGERVQREFKSAWISATEDSRDHTGSLPWIKKDRNTHEYLQGISAAVADFYAMDLVPCQAFRDAIQHIVDRFTQRNHLLCLLIMLSRANSHFGKSLPHTFYQDLMWEVRLKCQRSFSDVEGPQWQENAVLRLCQGLIQHANDDLSDEAEIGMPYSYIHSDDLNTEAIFSVAQDELDELKLLDIRYLKETQVELAPPSASKATSINNVDAPTIDENPLGDSTLYDDDDDEYVCLEDWFAGSPETMSEVGCTDRVLTYVIEGPESAKSSTTDLAEYPNRFIPAWRKWGDPPIWNSPPVYDGSPAGVQALLSLRRRLFPESGNGTGANLEDFGENFHGDCVARDVLDLVV